MEPPKKHEHSGPGGGAVPLHHTGKIDLFAQIEQYNAEFQAAAARKPIDEEDEKISDQDLALAGFAPKKEADNGNQNPRREGADPAHNDLAIPLAPNSVRGAEGSEAAR
jgi:hypothetical protein